MIELARNRPDSFDVIPEGGVRVIQDLSWELQSDLKDDNYSVVERDVDQVLRDLGATASPEKRRELAQALMQAQINGCHAVLATMADIHGNEWSHPAVPEPERRPSEVAFATTPEQQTVRAAIKGYAWEHRNRWSKGTARNFHAVARLFQDYIGDRPIAEVTRDDASAYLEKIAGLSSTYGKAIKGDPPPLNELLRRYPGQLSPATIRRHAVTLHALFEWATERGWYTSENPFAELLAKATAV